MKKKTSYADFVEEWQHLLNSLEGDASLTDMASKPRLEAALARVSALSAAQARHLAAKQVATKELQQAVKEAKDLARVFRFELKFRLGDRTEQLVQFRVKPLREKRRPKAGTEEGVKSKSKRKSAGKEPAAAEPIPSAPAASAGGTND